MSSDIKSEKTELREAAIKMRNALEKDNKVDYDCEIESRVIAHKSFIYADAVFTYVSTEKEVDTLGLIHAAWAVGKTVAVPKCDRESNVMIFYVIKSMDDLKPGYFGILEPDEKKCEPAQSTANSLCIVPGLCFDAEGYRIGYGKGYYDRFLSGYKGLKVGICYSDCIKWALPRGKYDRPVDILITDRFFRVIRSDKTERRV